MIADVFKDIYKGQLTNSRRQNRVREVTTVRRAQPVEDDQSD
jgi:hypothetical protein